MYAAKFLVFSIITVMATLASASPVPEAALDLVLAKKDLLSREPLPVAEAVAVPKVENVGKRICRRGIPECL